MKFAPIIRPIIRIIFFILIIEALLRLDGAFFSFIQKQQNIRNYQKNAYRIICIGDSMTAFGQELSYPQQLQNILNNSKLPIKFEVLNLATPAANSTQIFGNLSKILDEYKPKMVLVMMGANDRQDPVLLKHSQSKNKLFDLSNHLKICKLISNLWLQLKNHFQRNKFKYVDLKDYLIKDHQRPLIYVIKPLQKKSDVEYEEKLKYTQIQNASALYNFQKYTEAEFLLSSLFEKRLLFENTSEPYLFITTGELLLKNLAAQEKFTETFPVMDYLFARIPHNNASTDLIRILCSKKLIPKQLKNFLYGQLEKYPENINLIGLMASCSINWGDKAEADKYFQKLEFFRNNADIIILKNNYIAVANALKERNIKGVFVQYPTLKLDTLKRFFDGVENNHDFTFVDNEDSFKESSNPEKYSEYFMDREKYTFGHPTPKGNHIIAENIAKVILKEFFFLQ